MVSAHVSRYLGVSLGGAKSDRTCLTVLDHYTRSRGGAHGRAEPAIDEKTFVVDIFESIGSEEDLTSDQVLLDLVAELSGRTRKSDSDAAGARVRVVGVDAPLTLPPCLTGCDESCIGYEKCKRPAVRWMRQQYTRAKSRNARLKHFTPYSQRPVDLYFRYKYPGENLFQDETMGANLAPQAARMSYLKKHFVDIRLVEIWPKLALFCLLKELRLTRREVFGYRNIEEGVKTRQKALDRICEKGNVFVYDRDFKKCLESTAAFDSFLCGWVALQSDLDRVVKFRPELPLETGWVQIPQL